MSQARIPKKKDRLRPCVPLVPVKLDKAQKIDLVGMKCRIDPTDSDSEVYDKTSRKFSGGEPDEWITVLQDLDEVWTANDTTQPLHRVAIVKTLTRGEAW